MEKTISPSITFQFAGASVTIPEATITELWLDRARLQHVGHLRIGETSRAGGIFMGIVRSENGAPDYYLYDLGEADKRLPWAEAMKWAEEKGGALPTRRELSVMFGNRGAGQYQEAWYWSCEQSAGNESYAWVQYFDGGGQDGGRKSGGYRARAVRREPIQ